MFLFVFVLQAYVYTKASKIVGVEMNADLCNIQNKLIKKYNFQVPIRFIGCGNDMYRDMCSDMYRVMCSDMYSDMCSDMYRDMCSDMYRDMCRDMYSDMCNDMYRDMCNDMYSDILSHKLEPSALLFSYWKKTNQITSHCAGSLFYVANIICHSR